MSIHSTWCMIPIVDPNPASTETRTFAPKTASVSGTEGRPSPQTENRTNPGVRQEKISSSIAMDICKYTTASRYSGLPSPANQPEMYKIIVWAVDKKPYITEANMIEGMEGISGNADGDARSSAIGIIVTSLSNA